MVAMAALDPTTLTPDEFLRYLQGFYAKLNGVPIADGGVKVSKEDLQGLAARFGSELEHVIPKGVDPVQFLTERLGGKLSLGGPNAGLLREAVETAFNLLS